jgi:3'-phosphoadenosine 5'-phosphosulfate (PAPS) 3'-phosphatase
VVTTRSVAAEERAARKTDLDKGMEAALDSLVGDHGQALADSAKIAAIIDGTVDTTVRGVVLSGPLQGRKVNLTITIDPID